MLCPFKLDVPVRSFVNASAIPRQFFIPFLNHFMNKHFLQKTTGILFACALIITSLQTAHAQTSRPAEFDGNNGIRGNQYGAGSNFQIRATLDGYEGPYIHMYPNTNGSNGEQGSINFIAGYNPASRTGIAHGFLTRNNTGGYFRVMQILQDGTVQVGDRFPTTQSGYKMSVQGKLVAQSLYVTNPGTWADFVFEPSYELMALPTLESYLKKNKHLPYIPSAKEVEANGYNVAEMDAKLLRTVEELSLQLIELNRKIEELKASKQDAVK